MQRVLSVFALTMINIIAIASLRTLPFGAKFGLALIFYYFLGAMLFFIPVALITAELATTWPKAGGIYVWIREAFGNKTGLLVVWLQWVYNIVWYPTILSLIAGVTAFLWAPSLVDDPIYMASMVLGTFWLATLVNCFGMKLSSLISTIGSIFGTLLPMLVIIGMGIYWLVTKKMTNIVWHWTALVPQIYSIRDLVLINTILFGLIGLEMSAVHAQDVKNPEKNYPRALTISSIIILLTLVLASLAMAIIIPGNELHLVVGPIQVFQVFFQAIGATWLLPITAILLILGAVSCVATWIIGPTKGLLAAANDGCLPKWLTKTNKYGVPIAILFCQGIVVSGLSLIYLLIPTAEGAYLLLTELTAVLALLMYVMMFGAALVLRYKFPNIKRPYKIPFGNLGIFMVVIIGGGTSLFAMLLGFIPPSQVNIGKPWVYQAILIVGTIVFCIPAWFLGKKSQEK